VQGGGQYVCNKKRPKDSAAKQTVDGNNGELIAKVVIEKMSMVNREREKIKERNRVHTKRTGGPNKNDTR